MASWPGCLSVPHAKPGAMAADLSSKLHVRYVDRKFKSVLGVAPHMYDDIWTAGKVMYKLEPVIEKGGELIILRSRISMRSAILTVIVLDQIGYHCRDYFLAQMEKFEGVPRGIMAHSTHVRGGGSFVDGVESCDVKVTLASAISRGALSSD